MKNILLKLKNEKGQSAVEFSLVAILLFLLVFGIMEIGRGWFRADKLKGAANIAARTFAITKDSSQASAVAQAAINNASEWSITTLTTGTSPSDPNQVIATISQPFNTVVGGLIPGLKGITITRTATYRLEP